MSEAAIAPHRHKLSHLEVLSYGGGSVASSLSWNMVAGFLIVYYTDTILLPVAAVGTLVFLTRLIDALFDPVVGMLVDRTRSRWGKARPYLLFMPIPFAILCVLTFAVPEGTTNEKLVYAYITFGLLGLVYSLLYVPYGALQPLLTSDRPQLLTISSVRAMGTSVASIFVYALVVPTIAFFGGGRDGYTWAAAVFALCTTALYFVTFANCRERTAGDAESDRSPFKKAFSRALRNRVWVVAMLFEILIFIRLGIMTAAMAFYARIVLGSAASISILLPTLSVGILLGGFIAAPYLRRFGKRRGVSWFLLFTIFIFALVPVIGHTVLGFSLILFFGAIGAGVQATMVFAVVSESVEAQLRLFGFRDAGLLTSFAAFNSKVGFALGSAGVAWALALADYSPNLPAAAVAPTLIWIFCLSPIVLSLLQLVVIRYYPEDMAALAADRAAAA
ncbi:MFS transporter [Sphingomonas sp.]|uniref:MFS transporter n=1 Tax=Sphingomonas sp. TaxID=28214 RepID=UPI0035A988C7